MRNKGKEPREKAPPAKPRKPKWLGDMERALESEEKTVKKGRIKSGAERHSLAHNAGINLWHLWQKFSAANVTMVMKPAPEQFLKFSVFPEQYEERPDFEWAVVDTISIVDTTRSDNRTGDSLSVSFVPDGKGERLRIVFELIEGEKYHKYSGWKRHISRFILFDAPAASSSEGKAMAALADIARVWYGSHLKNDRAALSSHLRKKFDRSEVIAV